MQTLDHDEVSAHVTARPDDVYALVADVTRTRELSPEVVSCEWIAPATGPAVGARFRAVNKVPGRPSWTNTPVVTVADPGREFAFTRTERCAGSILWRYRFEAEGDGTRVTESYEVIEPVSRLGWLAITYLHGRRDRRADLRAGMMQTLRRIQVAAERGTLTDARS